MLTGVKMDVQEVYKEEMILGEDGLAAARRGVQAARGSSEAPPGPLTGRCSPLSPSAALCQSSPLHWAVGFSSRPRASDNPLAFLPPGWLSHSWDLDGMLLWASSVDLFLVFQE